MSVQISRILHAGYAFESAGAQILFDPIFENPFSRNCFAFPEVEFDSDRIRDLKPAAIFISHFHDDHCSLESLNLLSRETPIYLYCLFERLFELIRSLGFQKVYSLEIDKAVHVGPFEVIPRRALDADVDCMFHVRVDGLNILNVVDSWIDPDAFIELARFAPWDLVLWPFQTMRETAVISPRRNPPAPESLPQEWFDELSVLNPKFIVPSSCQFRHEDWSWYNHALFPISYRQFDREIGRRFPHSSIVRMDPSRSFLLEKSSFPPLAPLEWVKPVGEQDVDYDFVRNIQPPPTAHIARHFAPLTAEQMLRVSQFCQTGIIEKYQALEPSDEAYFKSKRIWRLTIYDHLGVAKDFHYQLQGQSMTLLNDGQKEIDWLTEVIATKLYGALEEGESLTSMYVRINDCSFPPEIEKEIPGVDVVEDPLIRCLFTTDFAAYQAEQLRRIKLREGSHEN